MRNYSDFDQILLNIVFKTLWVISRPFVWIYSLLKWFVLAVIKETGNKVVKIVGGFIAIGIVGMFIQLLK